MGSKAKPRSGPVVVVEIGNDWLKILQLEPTRGGLAIVKAHLEKFDALDDSVSAAISQAQKTLRFPKIPVLVSLPRQMVNIRMLELPSVDPDEIADMVDLQSGKQTPYSKEEVASDFRVMGAAREGYTRVMLAIVQRAVVRQRFSVIEDAGLEIERMCVSTEGLVNWLTTEAVVEAGTTMVLDVDSFYSDFVVVRHGVPVFSRSILLGANHLLSDLERWKGKLATEVERSWEICRGEMPGIALDSGVVGGAGARMKGLSDVLGEALGVPVRSRDVLSEMKRLPKTPLLESPEYAGVSLSPLVGIALAPDALTFNFVPDSVRLKRALMSKARRLTLTACLTMAALLIASLCGTAALITRFRRLEQVRGERKRTAPAAEQVVRMQEVVKAISQRRDSSFAAVNILSAINSAIGGSVYITSIDLDVDGGRAVLDGTSANRPDIRAVEKALRQLPVFRAVEEGGATELDNRSSRYRFRLVCILERT